MASLLSLASLAAQPGKSGHQPQVSMVHTGPWPQNTPGGQGNFGSATGAARMPMQKRKDVSVGCGWGGKW